MTGRWEYWKMIREKRSWDSSRSNKPVAAVCDGKKLISSIRQREQQERSYRTEYGDLSISGL